MINSLEDAIKHCEEVAERLENSCKRDWMSEDDRKCAADHRQLAEWLKKLLAYEEAREKIELKSDKCPNPEIRYGMRYALYVQEKCLEEVNANENSD